MDEQSIHSIFAQKSEASSRLRFQPHAERGGRSTAVVAGLYKSLLRSRSEQHATHFRATSQENPGETICNSHFRLFNTV